MTEPITLRDRTTADEPLLFALFAETKAADLAPLGLTPEQLRPLLEMQYRGREMTYAAGYARVWDALICHSSTAVGRILIDRASDHWRLIDIAVQPSSRGRGIASQVIQLLQQQCQELRIPLRLSVPFGNPAQLLYARLGFVMAQPSPARQASDAEFAMDQAMEWNPVAARMRATQSETTGSKRIA